MLNATLFFCNAVYFIFFACKTLFGAGVGRLPQTAKGQSPILCYAN